jgi:hypothetical protein
MTGACRCGSKHCLEQHSLAAWLADDPKKTTLAQFVYRAVHGPFGLDTAFQANSIPQGMMFPRLRDEKELLAEPVEFKQCHVCGWKYEGATCIQCGAIFSPTTTKVVCKPWIIIAGVYLEVWRWKCDEGPNEHYYSQQLCRTVLKKAEDVERARRHSPRKPTPPNNGSEEQPPEPDRFHVVGIAHDRPPRNDCPDKIVHDRCPWNDCPNKPDHHGQRATSLWIRAHFEGAVAGAGDPPPGLIEGIERGMRRALEAMDAADQRRLQEEFGDNPLQVMRGLAADEKKRRTLLTDAKWEKVTGAIRGALEKSGVGEEEIAEFLRGHYPNDGDGGN